MVMQKLKQEIGKMTDPRRSYGHLIHKLEYVVIIGLLCILCKGEYYNEMQVFGTHRAELLRTFLELSNGIPDSDTFRRLFERLDPKELSKHLNQCVEITREKSEVINIDGKTIRGSANKEHGACHVVSAWLAENQLTLGEIKTEEKSNEITAVPALLDMIDVEGSIVTADAMSCQKAIQCQQVKRLPAECYKGTTI